jgi:ribokinase
VTAVGAVGGDGLGRDILTALAREGIDVGSVQSRPDVATPVCVCFVGAEGETSFVWHIDEGAAVTPDTVRAAAPAIKRADAVLMTFELSAESIAEAIRAAKRHGARVIVQPAPPLADPFAAASLPWCQVDVLVPNETEARALLTSDHAKRAVPPDALASAVASALALPAVVVTLGGSGCVVHAAGETRRYPVQKTRVVDTTGASDAFTATLAAHLTADASEADAIHAAQSAAAWAIGHLGGHESMPSSP